MSEKKRKTNSQGGERPSKKQQTSSNVKVRHLECGEVKPVIGSANGIKLPKEIKFQSFAQKATDGSSRLLLHSSEHSTIDYTALEGDSSADQYLKHYVAVYDPSTGELEVTPARKLNVRGTIRLNQPVQDEDSTQITNYSSRAALTEAFGTKKSRKAVQSMAENRLLAQSDEADNPVSSAMMSNLNDLDNEDADQAASLANKPIPQPNLHTSEISEIYSLDNLIFPGPASQTLSAMPTNDWVTRISSKQPVLTRSRFVASRVTYLTKHLLKSPEASNPNLSRNLHVLRYIELLVEMHNHLRNLPHRKAVPRLRDWPEGTLSSDTPSIGDRIPSRFFTGDRLPTTHAMTLLRTTILALTLHVPPPSLNTGQGVLATEITDIGLDLAIDASELRKLFRELGCKVEPATDTELARWGLEKLSKKKKTEDGVPGGNKLLFAKLRLPLTFPKMSRGKPQGKR